MEDHSDSSIVEEKIAEGSGEKVQNNASSSSSSSSDSDSEKPASSSPSATISRLFGREKSIHDVLGGGKPANLFLWRNKKVSGGTLVGVTAIWIFLELLEYHLLTLICYVLISSLALLFVWSNAYEFINKSRPKLPEIRFSEDVVVEFASAVRFEANKAIGVLRGVASGRDVKKLLFIVTGLWILAMVGSWCSFLTLFYISFLMLNVIPGVYEKYEDKIEAFLEKAFVWMEKKFEVLDAKVLSKIPRGSLKKKKF